MACGLIWIPLPSSIAIPKAIPIPYPHIWLFLDFVFAYHRHRVYCDISFNLVIAPTPRHFPAFAHKESSQSAKTHTIGR